LRLFPPFQDGVPECLEALSTAGIKIWVLTGDKVRPAKGAKQGTTLHKQRSTQHNKTTQQLKQSKASTVKQT
jgi:P-type E1-E2 ATPase